MGVTALWTAAHYRIPLLIVVANNRSFYNDEVHQERVARMRNRPVENKWIGQRISDPDIDLATLARAQGAVGFGPVEDVGKLAATFAEGDRRGRAGPGRGRRRARRAGLYAGDDGSRVERREEERDEGFAQRVPHTRVCSPPPCGEGLGVGVAPLVRWRFTKRRPPSPTLPRKGGGSTPPLRLV